MLRQTGWSYVRCPGMRHYFQLVCVAFSLERPSFLMLYKPPSYATQACVSNQSNMEKVVHSMGESTVMDHSPVIYIQNIPLLLGFVAAVVSALVCGRLPRPMCDD